MCTSVYKHAFIHLLFYLVLDCILSLLPVFSFYTDVVVEGVVCSMFCVGDGCVSFEYSGVCCISGVLMMRLSMGLNAESLGDSVEVCGHFL